MRRLLALFVAVCATAACVSILGLDNDKYLSLEDQFCLEYQQLCGSRAASFGIPIDDAGPDATTCHGWIGSQLTKPAADPTRPQIQKYTDLECPSKTTCEDFLDCVEAANFLQPGMCGQAGCLADQADADSHPWRCCAGDHCFDIQGSSACLAKANWSCLEAMPDGGFDAGSGDAGTVAVPNLPFVDINTMAKIAGLDVRACARLDVSCASPLEVATPNDAGGYAFNALPVGFDGYLQALDTTRDGGTAYKTLLVVINPPLSPGVPVGQTGIPMFLNDVYAAITTAFGTPADKNDGHIFSFAFDCTNKPAKGVKGELDKPAQANLYFANNQPTMGQMETDQSGQFGFVNVVPGSRVLTVRSNGLVVGSVQVFVRADCLTFAPVLPTR